MPRLATLALGLATLLATHAPARAATFVVDSIGDDSDATLADGVCFTASGECTLRAAIEQANASNGQDVIHFKLAGPADIRPDPALDLPPITDALQIDGYSQPGAARNTAQAGTNAQLLVRLSGFGTGSGLRVLAGPTLIRGLEISGFATGVAFGGAPPQLGSPTWLAGSEIRNCATGVFIDTSGVRVGNLPPAERNAIHANTIGVRIDGDGNFVVGNLFGLDASGSRASANDTSIWIDTPGSSNSVTDNVISGLATAGVRVDGDDNTLVRNVIGLSADGSTPVPNQTGVTVSGTGNHVGLPFAPNTISGNGVGIELLGDANVVRGNWIGTGLGGAGAFGNGGSLAIVGSGNRVGGAALGDPNIIANTQFSTAVRVVAAAGRPALRNSLRGNTWRDNAGMDIDLGADNRINLDSSDLDVGPNDLLNPPEIDRVVPGPSGVLIEGKLDAPPGSYELDFWSAGACDAQPDTGAAQLYLGSTPVTVTAGGGTFSDVFRLGPGRAFTGMATNAAGSSSELGPCFDASSAGGADLGVAIAPVPTAPLAPGAAVSFDVTLRNDGPDAAAAVEVAVVRPPGFAAWSTSGPGSYDATTGAWSLGSLGSGASASLRVDATLAASALGAIPLIADARQNLAQPDPRFSNNLASLQLDVAAGADLEVTQTAPPGLQPGASAAIDVTVRNRGPEAALSVVLTGRLDAYLELDPNVAPPSGLGYDAAARRWSLALGDLAVGGETTVQIPVRAATAAPLGGAAGQTAFALAGTPFDPTQVVSEVGIALGARADLSLSFLASTFFGADVEYLFELEIQGPDTPSEIVISVGNDQCATGESVRIELSSRQVSGTCPLRASFASDEIFDQFQVFTSSRSVLVRVDAGPSSPAYDPNPDDNSLVAVAVGGPACGLLGIEAPLLLGALALLPLERSRRWRRLVFGVAPALALLALGIALPSSARATPFAFAVDGSASALSLEVETPYGTTAPVALTASGTLAADVALGVDAQYGLLATDLQVTSARIAFSDASAGLALVPLFDLAFATRGVSASFTAPPASGFAAATGRSLFALGGASFLFDAGVLDVSGTSFGAPVAGAFDLATLALAGFLPLGATATAQVVDLGGGASELRLTLPVELTLRLTVDGDALAFRFGGALAFVGRPAPEPAAASLLALCALAVGWRERTRRALSETGVGRISTLAADQARWAESAAASGARVSAPPHCRTPATKTPRAPRSSHIRGRGASPMLSRWSSIGFSALLVAVPMPALAASLVQYDLSARSTSGSVLVGDTVPLTTNVDENAVSGNSQASASYDPAPSGEFAEVRVRAATSWPAAENFQVPGQDHSASASIRVNDTFIVNKPLTGPGSGPTDYRVDLTFSIQLSGSVSQSGGTTLWNVEASMRGNLYRDANRLMVQPGIGVDAQALDPGAIPVPSLPLTLRSSIEPGPNNPTSLFLYGEPIDLSWWVAVQADGNRQRAGDDSGFARADLSHTAVWLGITARDEQGQIIEGLQITSASGLNWLDPPTLVPEPATAGLLMTALGAASLVTAGTSKRARATVR